VRVPDALTVGYDKESRGVVHGVKERVSVFEMTKLVNAHLGELDPSEPQKPQEG
jgi:hypothetical protein